MERNIRRKTMRGFVKSARDGLRKRIRQKKKCRNIEQDRMKITRKQLEEVDKSCYVRKN